MQFVLFSIQVFWSRHFLLPKRVISAIDQICCNFLWSGKDEKAYEARVSWFQICHPKSEAVLGLKNLELWSKACALNVVWSLIMKFQSLWITRYRNTKLRGLISEKY